jgi:hypothetical protein
MSDRVQSSAPPVSLEELSSALDGSVLNRTVARMWRSVVAAATHSWVMKEAGELRGRGLDEASVLGFAGIVVVVAMAVHLLLLTVQAYPYPGYSTYWLPTVLLTAGVVMLAGRRALAAAWRDRMHR